MQKPAYGLLFALVVGWASSGASAQKSMTCTPEPMSLHCVSDDDDKQTDWGDDLAALIKQRRENAFRKKVGKLLTAGDCRAASKLAYEKGRLELGQQIAQTCPPNSER